MSSRKKMLFGWAIWPRLRRLKSSRVLKVSRSMLGYSERRSFEKFGKEFLPLVRCSPLNQNKIFKQGKKNLLKLRRLQPCLLLLWSSSEMILLTLVWGSRKSESPISVWVLGKDGAGKGCLEFENCEKLGKLLIAWRFFLLNCCWIDAGIWKGWDMMSGKLKLLDCSSDCVFGNTGFPKFCDDPEICEKLGKACLFFLSDKDLTAAEGTSGGG